MKRIELQTHLDNLIDAACTTVVGPVHVCWYKDQICVLPLCHTKQKHHVFMTLRSHHRKRGLTSDEWDVLTDKIFESIERIGLCQKQSEH